MKLGKNFLYTIVPVLLLAVLASCTPTEKTTECDNDEAYDSSSRKCVATLSSAGNLINIGSKSPRSSYSVASNSPNAITHQVSITNPNKIDYVTKWYRHDEAGNTTRIATNKLSYSYVPLTLSPQIYVFEVILFDEDGDDPIDSKSWTVIINPPAPPSFSSPSPGATVTKVITDPDVTYSAIISNLEFTSSSDVVWSVDGTVMNTDSIGFNDDNQTVDYTVDISTLEVGSHSIEAVVTDGTDVFHTENWTLNITAEVVTYPVVNTQSPSVANIYAINGIALSAGTSFFETDSTVISDFCVSVDDVLGSDGVSGVRAVFYENGIQVGSGSLVADDTDYCLLGDLGYDATYGSVGSSLQQSHTIMARIYDLAGDDTELTSIVSPIIWNITARAANTAPTIEIDTASSEGSCTYTTNLDGTNCTIVQDASTDFIITVNDEDNPDYLTNDLNEYEVDFELEASNLDGATHDLSSSDCQGARVDGVAKYTCSLVINSYDANGPINTPVTYELTATVKDNASIYGGSAMTSNEVSWSFSTTTESDTAPVVATAAAPADNGATPTCSGAVTDLSFFATVGAPTVVIDTIDEDTQYEVQTCFTDAERDDFESALFFCQDGANCLTTVPIGSSNATSRSDDDEYVLDTNTVIIPQDIITGAASGTAYFKTRITSVNDSSGLLTHDQILEITVNNDNPIPVVLGDHAYDPTTDRHVIAGFPFTIDPGTITDGSTLDGENLEYQWEIDIDQDGTFVDIDGADSRVLVWTPDMFSGLDLESSGLRVTIRLRIGDDGYLNDVDSSPVYAPDLTGWNNVYIWPNFVEMFASDDGAAQEQSDGEVAIWVDGQSTPVVTYTAYITGSGNTITVEKLVYNQSTSDGETSGSALNSSTDVDSVTFNAVDGETVTCSNISISGDTDEIFIAYQCDDVDDSITSGEFLSIRRIVTDQTSLKTGFVHGGLFDFKYDITTSETSPALSITANTISINGAAATAGDTFTIEGITFTEGSTATYTCVACSNATLSGIITNLINSSNEPALQGVSAVDNTTSVTLLGIGDGDDLDYSDTNFHPSSIGSIQVYSGKWYIPVLDGDQPGTDKNKVSIIHGDAGVRLSASSPTKVLLGSTEQSTIVRNTLDRSNNLVMAYKTYAGDIDIYSITLPGLADVDSELDLFPGETIGDFNIAAGKVLANPNIYIAGINTGTTNNLSLVVASDSAYGTNEIENYNATATENISSLDISAGLTDDEAFIGINFNSSASEADTAYLFHVTSSDGTNYDVSCGDCVQINQTYDTLPYEVAISRVIADLEIGDDGDGTDENIKDSLFFNIHIDDTAQTDVNIQSSVINIEEESLDTQSTSPGFGQAFVKPE